MFGAISKVWYIEFDMDMVNVGVLLDDSTLEGIEDWTDKWILMVTSLLSICEG